MNDDMTPAEIEEIENAMDDLEEQQDAELQAHLWRVANKPVWLDEDYYNANAVTANRNIELKLQGKFADKITLLRPNVEGSVWFVCVMTAGKLIRISFFACCPSQANEDDFDNATEQLGYNLAELVNNRQ